MTEADVLKAVQAIEESKEYHEAAHKLKDKLLWEFIDWVADEYAGRAPELTIYARLIQKSKYIEFPRNCG